MEYWVWKDYPPGSGFAAAEDLGGLTEEEEWALHRGEPLAGPLPHVTVGRLSAGALPDVLGTPGSLRLVSAPVRGVLEAACGGAVQFLPATLRRYRRLPYFLANFTARVDCFDRDRSGVESFPEYPGSVRSIRHLMLKPVPEGAPPVFHLAGVTPILLARDDIRARLESVSPSTGIYTEAMGARYGIT